ncbi:MAG: hypothetical protein JKY87_02460 [Mariprofundus sp.]|nr:hypothetical protein [Mariprofundus sp.]
MSKSTDAVQTLASSLASVADNAQRVHLLIFGGGRDGKALLDVLRHYNWVNIHAIVDISEQAIAFPLAKQWGIPTSIDGEQHSAVI